MNDKLATAEDATAYVGVSYGALGVKWGPYTGPQAGEFMRQLTEIDPNSRIPFFVSIDFGPIEDPVSAIVEWTQADHSEPQTVAKNMPIPLGTVRGEDGAIWSTHGWQAHGRVWVTEEQIAPAEAHGWERAPDAPAPFMDTMLYALQRSASAE